MPSGAAFQTGVLAVVVPVVGVGTVPRGVAESRSAAGDGDASVATVHAGADAGDVQDGVPLAAQEELRAAGNADHRRGNARLDNASQVPCA